MVNIKRATVAGTSGSGTGYTWNDTTGTSATMVANNAYIADNASLVTFTLPATAVVGTLVRVVGYGAGGWKIAQNASQLIDFGNVTSTTGTTGYVSSNNRYDCIELVCVVANTTWVVLDSQGSITIY